MRFPFCKPTPKPPINDGYVKILKVSNGAVLGQRRDGTVVCAVCPFCCSATSERCEFSDDALPRNQPINTPTGDTQ